MSQILTPTPTASAAPQRTGDLGTREIHVYVFDLSRGYDAAIAGAIVRYEKQSQVNSPMVGSAITDAGGAVAFSLFLNETDQIRIRVLAIDRGFFPRAFEYTGSELRFTGAPLQFGLHPGYCAGDCNGDGVVTVDELVLAVGLALDGGGDLQCTAVDANADAQISIDELIAAVQRDLNGCGFGVTPSPTPTSTETPANTCTITATRTITLTRTVTLTPTVTCTPTVTRTCPPASPPAICPTGEVVVCADELCSLDCGCGTETPTPTVTLTPSRVPPTATGTPPPPPPTACYHDATATPSEWP